jgi:hypothetical protein
MAATTLCILKTEDFSFDLFAVRLQMQQNITSFATQEPSAALFSHQFAFGHPHPHVGVRLCVCGSNKKSHLASQTKTTI